MKKHIITMVMIISMITILTVSAFATSYPEFPSQNHLGYGMILQVTSTGTLYYYTSPSSFTVEKIDSQGDLIYSNLRQKSASNGKMYRWNTETSQWVWQSDYYQPTWVTNLNGTEIKWADHDILIFGTSTVFFSKISRLVEVAKTLTPMTLLQTILGILASLIGLVISLIALRKAWKWLSGVLRNA